MSNTTDTAGGLDPTRSPRLKLRVAEGIGAGMTIKVNGTLATVTAVRAEAVDQVIIDHTEGCTTARMGQHIAVAVDEGGRPVRAPEPTAEQVLTRRRSVHVPTPREWQRIANTALRWILDAPDLPLVTWKLYDIAGGYIKPLQGQVTTDDGTAAVKAYAEFLDVEAELCHDGDRIRAHGIYLGCPVEVWGQTAQLAEKQRREAEGAGAR